MIQDPAGQRSADDARHRNGSHEQRGDPAAPGGGEPVGQVQDDSREEARLRHAEQKPQHIERGRRLNKHHGGRDQAPGNHDAGDPPPGAHAVQDHVARHLEQEIADEEDPRAQAVYRLAERKRVGHLQLGKADIDPVEVGKKVADE
ncbi:hypothetical protein D3C87_1296170 [compost metagenome]